MFQRPQTPQWQTPHMNFPYGYNSNGGQFSPITLRGNDQLVNQVKRIASSSPQERYEAIRFLSVQRESFQNIGQVLWDTPAVIAVLLSEIIAVYPHIASNTNIPSTTPSSISTPMMSHVCDSICLLQSVAGNTEVRSEFLKADIPHYLLPFLQTKNQSHECDHFKLAALGVIGTLAMSDSKEVHKYLLDHDFFPLCIRILRFGQDIHKILACYVMQRMLSTKEGKESLAASKEKVSVALTILNIVVNELVVKFDPRLSRNACLAYDYVLTINTAHEILKNTNFDELRKADLSKCDENFVRLVKKILSISSV